MWFPELIICYEVSMRFLFSLLFCIEKACL